MDYFQRKKLNPPGTDKDDDEDDNHGVDHESIQSGQSLVLLRAVHAETCDYVTRRDVT